MEWFSSHKICHYLRTKPNFKSWIDKMSSKIGESKVMWRNDFTKKSQKMAPKKWKKSWDCQCSIDKITYTQKNLSRRTVRNDQFSMEMPEMNRTVSRFVDKICLLQTVKIQMWAGSLKYFDGNQKSHWCWRIVFLKMSPKAWIISRKIVFISKCKGN